jgi:hypothetical protein
MTNVLFSPGEDTNALYCNTAEGDRYLSRHSPDYIGGIALINHNRWVYETVGGAARTSSSRRCGIKEKGPTWPGARIKHIRVI